LTENNNPHIDVWRRAQTLDDLGELTAKWIKGDLKYHPCYGEGVDSETVPLREILAKYNRKGFVTTFSQPAVSIGNEGCGQRACVEGYAREDLAKRIATLGLHTDLLIFIFAPGVRGGYQIPITVEEFHPFTWCGGCWDFEELDCLTKICGASALLSLRSAWKVTAIDLQWGREAYLWEHVSRVLDEPENPNKPYSVMPSPHLGLDTGFVS